MRRWRGKRRPKWDAPKWWPALYQVAERENWSTDFSGWHAGEVWLVTVDPKTGIAWTWCDS